MSKRSHAQSAAGSSISVRLRLDTASASAEELEPDGDAILQSYEILVDAAKDPLTTAAYESAIAEFKQSQKDVQLEDHPRWLEESDTHSTMLSLMSSWSVKDITTPRLCEAHSVLVPGGGAVRFAIANVGSTRFVEHVERLNDLLGSFATATRHVIARSDLSPEAKAAWACYNLLALHPFPDGNGRLARALANVVLRCCDVPFPVGFAAGTTRQVYRDALLAGHVENGNTRPLANLLRSRLRRSWDLLERIAARRLAAAQAESVDAAARSAREQTKKDGACVCCLGELPDAAMLCCGAAVHIGCMADWLVKKAECPTCREKMALHGQLKERATAAASAALVDDTGLEVGLDDTGLDVIDDTGLEADGALVDDTGLEVGFDDHAIAPAWITRPAAGIDDTALEAGLDDTALPPPPATEGFAGRNDPSKERFAYAIHAQPPSGPLKPRAILYEDGDGTVRGGGEKAFTSPSEYRIAKTHHEMLTAAGAPCVMSNVRWDDTGWRLVWTPLPGGKSARSTDALGPVGSFGLQIYVMPHNKLGLCQLRRGDETAPHWENPLAVQAVVAHCLVAQTLQIGDLNGRNFIAPIEQLSMPVAIDAAEQGYEFNFGANRISELVFSANFNGRNVPTPLLAKIIDRVAIDCAEALVERMNRIDFVGILSAHGLQGRVVEAQRRRAKILSVLSV